MKTRFVGQLCRGMSGLLLAGAVLFQAAGCGVQVQAADLMDDISPSHVEGKKADDAFVAAMADFSLKLFGRAAEEGGNVLISPLSVSLALAMTANGAAGETLREMETVLGGNIPLDTLNEYLHAYVDGLPNEEKAKLHIADSIWFRDEEDRLTVKKDFLQRNADYYGAAAYKSPFDAQTLRDINNWVKQHTDGMIEEILKEIPPEAVMYLVNAMAFDAEWQTIYEKSSIRRESFTTAEGIQRTVDMMYSTEAWYLENGSANGFIKPYKNSRYAFAALLPKERGDIKEFASSLTGEAFVSLMRTAEDITVSAALPRFGYDYGANLNDILKALGMPLAFDGNNADFSSLGRSAAGNIFIGNVFHKTFIEVDARGTRAGAATAVEMVDEAAVLTVKTVVLDRPFVYAILDTETGLPLFIGTVADIES